jgi:hypothetical protein
MLIIVIEHINKAHPRTIFYTTLLSDGDVAPQIYLLSV